MEFIITKEQKSMQKAAREFLKSECTSEFVREMEISEKGYTDKFWQKMGQLDWMALSIPEEFDGVGGDLIDLILMLEEMGRACVPGPFFSTVILGGFGLSMFGTEKQGGVPGVIGGVVNKHVAVVEDMAFGFFFIGGVDAENTAHLFDLDGVDE